MIPKEHELHHRAGPTETGLQPFVQGGHHSPSIKHWLATRDEGGGTTLRTRGSHAAESNSLEKGPAMSPSLHPGGALEESMHYTGMNGDRSLDS